MQYIQKKWQTFSEKTFESVLHYQTNLPLECSVYEWASIKPDNQNRSTPVDEVLRGLSLDSTDGFYMPCFEANVYADVGRVLALELAIHRKNKQVRLVHDAKAFVRPAINLTSLIDSEKQNITSNYYISYHFFSQIFFCRRKLSCWH